MYMVFTNSIFTVRQNQETRTLFAQLIRLRRHVLKLSRVRCDIKGFTLIEVMVVVSIIALIIAILVPTIGAARKRAKAAQVFSDFDAVARALEAFKADFGFFPPKPNPTRTVPGDPSRHNVYIYYYLVKCDYNMNGIVDNNEQEMIDKGRIYLEFPEERFDSNKRLLDPWGTPYGLLLPISEGGWSPADGITSMMPFRMWSNGLNLTTNSSNPGMDGIDDYVNEKID